MFCEWWSSWVNFTKFLTGASTVGGIAIPSILKHAGVIGWGAFAMELSSYFVFGMTVICYLWMSDEDEYSILWYQICFIIVKMNLFLSCAIAFSHLWLSLQYICFQPWFVDSPNECLLSVKKWDCFGLFSYCVNYVWFSL